MARNGSGTYTLPESDFTGGTVIQSSIMNSQLGDIETALTNSLAKDGQTTPTADLPMGGYNHTGVDDASARDHYAAAGQVQDSSFVWGGTAGGTANALTISLSPAITAYANGMKVRFIAASNNTGAATLNVNGAGAKAVQRAGQALVAGE